MGHFVSVGQGKHNWGGGHSIVGQDKVGHVGHDEDERCVEGHVVGGHGVGGQIARGQTREGHVKLGQEGAGHGQYN